MADKWREITLPTGATFKYDSTRSFDQIVDDYNQIKHKDDPENYPKIVPGGSWGERLTLSGQDQKSIQETLAARHPWQTQLPTDIGKQWFKQVKDDGGGFVDPVLGSVGGGGTTEQEMDGFIQNMYFDPESNQLVTLDEPGFSAKDVFADPAKGIARIAGETVATAAPVKKARAAGKLAQLGVRGLKGATGDLATSELWDAGAAFFGGLEEGRDTGEQVKDKAIDFATSFFGEMAAGVASGFFRGKAKKVGRGGKPLEEVGPNLDDYKFAMDEYPQSRGAITGPGAIRDLEDDLITRYPKEAQKLEAAVSGTDAVVRRRLDQLVEDIHPDMARPGEIGTQVRREFMGEKVPFGAVDDQGVPIPGAGSKAARTGGWVESGQASIDKKLGELRGALPGSTPIRARPEQPPAPYRPPGGPMEGAVPGRILNSPETIAAEAARKQESSFPFNVAPAGVKAPAPAPPPALPLEEAVKKMKGAGETSELITLAENVLSNPNATLDDLLSLQTKIGKRGGGRTGVPADMATQLYAATKASIRQMMEGNPRALELQGQYDKLAEEYYTKAQGELRSVFETTGGSVDPGASFTKLNGFTRGDGKPDLLAELFASISPDGGDLLRKAYLDKLFSKSPKASLNAYRGWSEEVKDLVVPPGTYRRQVLDTMSTMTDDHAENAMKLLSRPAPSASASKRGGALQSKAIFDAMAKLGGIGSVAGAITGNVPVEVAAGAVAINGVNFVTDVMSDFGKRIVARGRSDLLTSPAYMDFITTATKLDPGQIGSTEAAVDALISLTPRAIAEQQQYSAQDLRDIQALQEEWLSMVNDGTKASGRRADGILGPGGKPAPPTGLFSTTFTDTARR